MKRHVMTRLILGASLAYVGTTVLLPWTVPTVETDRNGAGFGSAETLMASYNEWEATYVANGGDRSMTIPLGSAKGLTTTSSTTYGRMILDLLAGTVSVKVAALPEGTWDVWLIENRPGSGRSVLPEPGDRRVRLGNLDRQEGMATLDVSLGRAAFAQFDPDLVTVTRAGSDPANDRLLVGTMSLFQRLHRSGQRGQFGRLSNADEPERPASDGTPWKWLFASVSPTAYAQIGPIPNPTTPLERLITRGRRSFFNDTFEGNGRTCGTCHRENRNLTIDPDFIATLPPDDPLFVAEFIPALMCTDPEETTGCRFENPSLMREYGLILENQDGFGDLFTRFNMRGVPHTLALIQNTLTPLAGDPFSDGTTVPPNERTGWSGDGAPLGGTLRDFIVGAVTQHYPKTLNRTPAVDFVLPTVAQMDALEAFQRSLGRRQDLVLTGPGKLRLRSYVAAEGQDIFNDPARGKCFSCHLNAGASVDGTHNGNFNTGVEALLSQPADVFPGQLNPPDGGFGGTVTPGGFGDGTFNTPALVEAADTGPFFHNNAVRTIEGAVAFYAGPAFNNSPGAAGLVFLDGSNGPGIQLDSTEAEAVAAFLRVINVLENLRSARDLANRVGNGETNAQVRTLSRLVRAELGDAWTVLNAGGLHQVAQQKLVAAIETADEMVIRDGKNLKLIAQVLSLIHEAEQQLKFP